MIGSRAIDIDGYRRNMTRGNFRCHREKEGMDDMDLGGTLVQWYMYNMIN